MEEVDTAVFERFLRDEPDRIVTSTLAHFELIRTAHRKEFEKGLKRGAAARIETRFEKDLSGGLIELRPLGHYLLKTFAEVLRACSRSQPAVLVRTADAIHLATAIHYAETLLVCSDIRMRRAARILGIRPYPSEES